MLWVLQDHSAERHRASSGRDRAMVPNARDARASQE